MKKFKFYTREQEEKIETLRKEAERQREDKRKTNERLKSIGTDSNNGPLKAGDPCRVVLAGSTLVGTVIEIKEGSNGKKVYNISTPLGPLKNFVVDYPKQYISKRRTEDLSDVEIPEALKTYTTQQLLRMLQIARLEQGEYGGTEFYTFEQIKAVLSTRPHISNKREARIVRKYQKIHK